MDMLVPWTFGQASPVENIPRPHITAHKLYGNTHTILAEPCCGLNESCVDTLHQDEPIALVKEGQQGVASLFLKVKS
jgi:hypothetical protein